MKRIAGIDPSLAACGLAGPDGDYWTIKPTKGPDDVAGRLHELYSRLHGMLASKYFEDLDFVVIEGYFVSPRTAGSVCRLAELGGVFRLALYERSIPFIDINPRTLKMWATGNGAAQKQEIVRTARNQGWQVRNDNEADAAWLRDIGNTFYNAPIDTWTTDQSALLERLSFPRLGI